MAKRDYSQMEYPRLVALGESDSIRATRHMNSKILCGLCKFVCCKSNIFIVETTPAESEKLGIPMAFPQNGSCPECTETGCKHGKDRPMFCKLFPVAVGDKGELNVPHWAYLHCPQPKHFTFSRIDENGKYVYHKKEGTKGPIGKNIQDEVRLDKPLEEFPTVLEMCEEGMVEMFGTKTLDKVRHGLAVLNGTATPPNSNPPSKNDTTDKAMAGDSSTPG